VKIAMLIYKYYPYGGQQRDFMRIALRCLEAGHQVDVYCLSWQGDVPDGIVRHLVPVSAISRHVLYQRYTEWTQAALKKQSYDVVVGFSKMPGLDVHFAADPCFAERMRRENRFISRYLPRYQHFFRYEQAVFGADRRTQVMILSPQQQKDFTAHYPGCEDRLHMLPPGISRDRLPGDDTEAVRTAVRDQYQRTPDELLILQVGSGFRVKGLDRSIRALAALPAALRQRARLLVIGQGRTTKYRRLARRLGVGDRVEFLGGRDDVPSFFAACDLYLNPAHYESAGYTIIEAIINGMPVLTTDACGYAFHVRQAGAGQVCPSPFRQKDLNARLHEMLISSDRHNWRSNGLAYVNKVDVFGMADTALAIIESAARLEQVPV